MDDHDPGDEAVPAHRPRCMRDPVRDPPLQLSKAGRVDGHATLCNDFVHGRSVTDVVTLVTCPHCLRVMSVLRDRVS